MISKSLIKEVKSFHQPKFRQMYNIFIAEGEKVCSELMKSSKYKIINAFILEESMSKYQNTLGSLKIKNEIISQREMEQITALKTASDIFLLLEMKEDDHKVLLKNDSSVIYLDGVQDPGNVGTIIRIADWFGIDAVIRSPKSADFFNPKVVQSTMGSMVNLDLFTTDYDQIIHAKKTIYGADMYGEPINVIKWNKNAILILGSEGKGISKELEKYIGQKVTIPGNGNKIAESLNVSVAAGIICSRWKGQ